MLNLTVRGLLPVERALKSKRIHNVELPEHDDPTSAFFRFLNFKTTPSETKIIIFVAAEQRQDSQLCIFDAALLLVVFIAASVEEYILFARVPMHITVDDYFAFPV